MTASIEQTSVRPSRIARAAEPRPRWRISDGVIVWALTLASGLFRFVTAARPPLWFDEAQTFRRTCGSFAQLIQLMRFEAFMPLHYYVYWTLGHLLGGAQHMTPFWMRFLPALAGTLMVPAMYALALRIVDRKSALLTAAFTAVSGFLMIYSHDAKMYMPLWMLVATNAACFLWWCESESKRAWAAFAISGVLMIGYHLTGAIVLMAEVVYFCSLPRTPSRIIAMVAALALIAAVPTIYYWQFTAMVHATSTMGVTEASGLHWVTGYNAGRDWLGRLMFLTSSYLCAWEWPRSRTNLSATLQLGFELVCVIVFFAAAAGTVAWIRLARRRISWRLVLFLGTWLIVPLYAGNVLSAGAGGLPMQAAVGLLMLMAALALTLRLAWPRIMLRSKAVEGNGGMTQLIGVAIAIAFIALSAGILALALGGTGDSTSVWVPRYLGAVWPAFAIALCAAIIRLPWRALRISAIVILLGVNSAQCIALAVASSEPPIDRVAADVWAAHESDGQMRTYVPAVDHASTGSGGGSIGNSVGRYYLSVLAGNPFGPPGFEQRELSDFATIRFWTTAQDIARDMREGELPSRIIIWCDGQTNIDPVIGTFPSDWRLIADEQFVVRGRGSWSELYTMRRLELARN